MEPRSREPATGVLVHGKIGATRFGELWTGTLTRTLTDRQPMGTTSESIAEILSGPTPEPDLSATFRDRYIKPRLHPATALYGPWHTKRKARRLRLADCAIPAQPSLIGELHYCSESSANDSAQYAQRIRRDATAPRDRQVSVQGYQRSCVRAMAMARDRSSATRIRALSRMLTIGSLQRIWLA